MTFQSLSRNSGVVSRRHASAVLAAGLALSPVAALAAEASAKADAPTVDSVTVTAAGGGYVATNSLSKLPADLQDVPQSVTVLNRALLQSQGVSSLADALKNVPGITIGGAEGGQIGNNINLNGFTARTDIFMDGFRDRGQYYQRHLRPGLGGGADGPLVHAVRPRLDRRGDQPGVEEGGADAWVFGRPLRNHQWPGPRRGGPQRAPVGQVGPSASP